MTTIADKAKGLPLPLFNVDQVKFKSWWMRFKVFATIKNFSLAIQRTNSKEPKLPATENEDVSSDNEKRLAKQRNLMAIACLIMAFQDDASLNILEKSETAEWPSGLAYIVLDELFSKYKPVEMRTRLSQVKMKVEMTEESFSTNWHLFKAPTMMLRERSILMI
jgi:hypothetical protein